MESQEPSIFSIGHSHAPLWYFRYLLLKHRIDLVVDCRTYPQSRFAPHFNKNALRQALAEKHISYTWKGRNLGGRGINTNYEETIDGLSDLARSSIRLCLLCAEEDYRRCHRHTVLEPSFNQRGIGIVHILHEDKPLKSKSRSKQNKLFQ